MSNSSTDNIADLAGVYSRLERLFDTYGADPARWPQPDRQLLAIYATDPHVARMASEAHALERVFALDPAAVMMDARASALVDRICAAAAHQAPAPASSNVLAFSPPMRRVAQASRRAGRAALAASLLLGVLIGTSGFGVHAVRYVSDSLGMADDDAEVASAFDAGATPDEVL